MAHLIITEEYVTIEEALEVFGIVITEDMTTLDFFILLDSLGLSLPEE